MTKLPAKSKLKPPSKRPKTLPYNGWRLEHGISQSMIQKFLVDKDRFHIRTVQGLKSTERKEAMEYGSIFHKLIEEGARMGAAFSILKLHKLAREYAQAKKFDPTSDLLMKIALAQYEEYHKWQADLPKYKYIAQEPVFAEEYTLPATSWNPCPEINISIPRTPIILRGRIDEVIDLNGKLYLQENKTKSRIDVAFIQDTIPENLQVMFYAVAAALKYGRSVHGFIYNIIRKPGIRQRVKEPDTIYIDRIRTEIQKDPNYYFYRFAYTFPPGAVAKWEKQELIPILYQIYLWWRSIEKNPMQPWEDAEGNPNPFHGRKPFGIYDPMVLGKGDYFDLLIYNRKHDLVVDHEMFVELKDDEE
jgi:hypothetical protein